MDIYIGWKCCKPRVLGFDEFLAIPPCTAGKHSTVDDTPVPEKPKPAATATETLPVRPVQPAPSSTAPSPAQVAEEKKKQEEKAEKEKKEEEAADSDDPSLEIPQNTTCRRRGCNESYNPEKARSEEVCVHHPGQPIFHEGSKGWSCCKRRVLEFDEFLKIPGCKEKKRHLFVGKGKPAGEEKVKSVR